MGTSGLNSVIDGKIIENHRRENHRLVVGYLKNMKVTWDDEIPNFMEKRQMFQVTNQSIRLYICTFKFYHRWENHRKSTRSMGDMGHLPLPYSMAGG